MTVGVAEVPGVDAPRPVVCRSDLGARSFGPLKQFVDLVAAFDQLAEAELAAARELGEPGAHPPCRSSPPALPASSPCARRGPRPANRTRRAGPAPTARRSSSPGR